MAIYQGIPESIAPYMLLEGGYGSNSGYNSSSSSSSSSTSSFLQGILGEDVEGHRFVGFKIDNTDNKLYLANNTDCPAVGFILDAMAENSTVDLYNNTIITTSLEIENINDYYLDEDGIPATFTWTPGKYYQRLGSGLNNGLFYINISMPSLMT